MNSTSCLAFMQKQPKILDKKIALNRAIYYPSICLYLLYTLLYDDANRIISSDLTTRRSNINNQ